MTSLDDRKTERFALELPARLETPSRSKHESSITVKTINVSAGGAFFQTDQKISLGTRVAVELTLPMDRLKKIKGHYARINLTGIVVRAVEQGLAVSFDEKYQILPVAA